MLQLLVLVAGSQANRDVHVGAGLPLARIDVHIVVVQLHHQRLVRVLLQQLVNQHESLFHPRLRHDPCDQLHPLLGGLHDRVHTRSGLVEAVCVKTLVVLGDASPVFLLRVQVLQALNRSRTVGRMNQRQNRTGRLALDPHHTARTAHQHVVQVHPVGNGESTVVLQVQVIDVVPQQSRADQLQIHHQIGHRQADVAVRHGDRTQAGVIDVLGVVFCEDGRADDVVTLQLGDPVAVRIDPDGHIAEQDFAHGRVGLGTVEQILVVHIAGVG